MQRLLAPSLREKSNALNVARIALAGLDDMISGAAWSKHRASCNPSGIPVSNPSGIPVLTRAARAEATARHGADGDGQRLVGAGGHRQGVRRAAGAGPAASRSVHDNRFSVFFARLKRAAGQAGPHPQQQQDAAGRGGSH